MPWIEIESYRVAVLHRPEGEVTRRLELQPVADHEGPGRAGIQLYFSASPAEAGYATDQLIVARLPEALFRDMYHVLQTERPAYFTWEETEEAGEMTGRPLRTCAVTTMEEPTGEGPIDLS